MHGLGDFLAGYLSAFLIAAATRSRLFVDHPFNHSLISFAPYDVAPSTHGRNVTVLQSFNRCPQWPSDAFDVLVYEGLESKYPANRACAETWRDHLGTIWNELQGDESAAVVYGCPLRYFAPKDSLKRILPRRRRYRRSTVAVHLRFGDTSFSPAARLRHYGPCSNLTSDMGQEIVKIAEERRRVSSSLSVRVESDDECARRDVSEVVGSVYELEPTVRSSHSVSIDQLASWFALSQSDLFVVSPMYHPRERILPYHDRYFKRRGFTDHGLLRLSSWSIMAALRSGTDRFHVLCSKPKPPGMDDLIARHPESAEIAPAYVCDSTRESAVSLAPKPKKGPAVTSENAHYQAPGTPSTEVIWWGIGTLV